MKFSLISSCARNIAVSLAFPPFARASRYDRCHWWTAKAIRLEVRTGYLLSSNPEIESQPSRANISSGGRSVRVDSAVPAFFRGLAWFRRSSSTESAGRCSRFDYGPGVEILGDNNASPVAPLISWKCNYARGPGRGRGRAKSRLPTSRKEIRPRSVSRGESAGTRERLLLFAELQWYK